MIKTRVWATFKGSHKSLGYVPGNNYRLAIWWDKHWLWVNNTGAGNTTEPCPYNSMEAFLNNWTVVEGLEKEQ